MDLGVLALVGRALIGGAFLVSGIRLLRYMPMVSGLLAAKRVPYPGFIAAAGGVFEFVMGLAAISGIWFPAVAIALAVFIAAAAVMSAARRTTSLSRACKSCWELSAWPSS